MRLKMRDLTVHIICFSPTGTSRRIAEAIARGMKPGEIIVHDVTLLSNKQLEIPERDFAIFAAPVYGGKMAPLAKERMEGIRGTGTPCAVVAVYGNRSFEKAVVDMDQFVKAQGFNTIAAGAFVGEHSYSTSEHPIAAGRPDNSDIEDCDHFGCKIAEKMSQNRSQPDVMVLKHAPDPDMSVQNFKNFVASYQQSQAAHPKKLIPQTDTNLCTGCGSCITVCPTQAIGEDCLTIEALRCIKCCACVKSCTSGARTLASPFAPVLSANFSIRKAPVWVL